jgi:hypothetical protein
MQSVQSKATILGVEEETKQEASMEHSLMVLSLFLRYEVMDLHTLGL